MCDDSRADDVIARIRMLVDDELRGPHPGDDVLRLLHKLLVIING